MVRRICWSPGWGWCRSPGAWRSLRCWRRGAWTGGAGLVRLVTGGGGAGKTRLALELCRRMGGRGWRCAQAGEGAERDVVGLERAAAPGARLLLVVDYAEARLGLEELLEAAARDAGRVRVLLLARHAGDWWQRLGAGSGRSGTWCRRLRCRLMPLAGDIEPGADGG